MSAQGCFTACPEVRHCAALAPTLSKATLGKTERHPPISVPVQQTFSIQILPLLHL